MIFYIVRKTGDLAREQVPGGKALEWIYGSHLGKLSLNALIKRKLISDLVGHFMDSRISKRKIAPFVKNHDIDLTEYRKKEPSQYENFNEFFYRKIDPARRPIDPGVISPADGKIVVFPKVDEQQEFFIKGSSFTLNRFLGQSKLASKFQNGSMAIIRLAPTDYHRFHFPFDAEVGPSIEIRGNYFSVSPIALKRNLEIFCRNKRSLSLLETKEYGCMAMCEVGATLTGSIIQSYSPGKIKKGNEKGYFAFGGSTVVLLFEENAIEFDQDLISNTKKGYETSIRMGERIGI